jgi:D-alanyl-D-alanine carboxypeptidase
VPNPRSAVLAAVCLVAAAVITPQGGAAAREDPVQELRRSASKARGDLEKATEQMTSRQKELARSQERLRATLKDLAKADAELDQIREPLARLANAAYQQPASGSMSIFGGGDASDALRATADVTHIAEQRQALVRKADELQRRRQRLTSTAQDLQSRHAVEQTRLQQEVDGLRAKSAQLTKDLTAKLRQLEAARERKLRARCDESLATKSRQFPNGLIPAKYLCDLPQKGEQLRADAALAFYKLNLAYKRRFGRDMCVTDSYRNLADQQRVYASRPGFAAVPGTSNHGKGQALDLCGGIQNGGSVQFNWMEANARRYGWLHPAWAYSNPYEPWHWEYGSDG